MPLLHAGLYAITDPVLLPDERLLPAVKAALQGGCKVIQYRDKTASQREKIYKAEQLNALCQDFDAQFIINDDLDLCLKVKAQGVHLGRSDGDIQNAREVLGPDVLIGVTCHNDLNYARRCIDSGVDYCAFGRIFPSLTKPEAPHCAIEILQQACQLKCPIVAIGGINLDKLPALMHTPIHSAAVIHGLFSQRDIQAAAQQFQQIFHHRIQV